MWKFSSALTAYRDTQEGKSSQMSKSNVNQSR